MSKPSKYNNVDELPTDIDGEVMVCGKVRADDFNSERDMVDYIVANMAEFCKDVLGDELVTFEREYQGGKEQRRFGPRDRRVDLYVTGENGKYLIEAKNPKYPSENRKAIGQLLDYGRDFLDSKKSLVLITTMFDIHTAKTIDFYNLPIRYIYFDKARILEWLRDG